MIDNESRRNTTLTDIIYFYKQQIERFKTIGIGNRTEFNTMVTDSLIDITLKRMHELQQRKDKLIFQARESWSNNGIK